MNVSGFHKKELSHKKSNGANRKHINKGFLLIAKNRIFDNICTFCAQ